MYRFLLFFTIGLIMTNILFANEKPSYEVLNVESIPGEKISINIIVSCPVTEDQLSLAAKIIYKNFHGPLFKRIFIDWYLPGMEIGHGVWATTHFDPRLQVKIMTWMLEHNPPNEQIYAE